MTGLRIQSTKGRFGAVVICLLVACFAQANPDNDRLDLADYKGKVVVLDFWASWCVPCRRSFPWLDEMQKKYADDGLVVVGVNEDANLANANAFLEEYPVDFRILIDNGNELARFYGIQAMPSSVVIGRNGELFEKHLGFRYKKIEEYEEIFRQALGLTAESDGNDVGIQIKP